MQIVGGQFRGRRLKTPKNRDIRPTSNRVREAIFDLLGPTLPVGNVLDLYAGTGALGLEALSRGYPFAVFVEKDPVALKIIRQNLELCDLVDQTAIVRMDVLTYLESLNQYPPFELVLLDPPYRKGLAEKTMAALDLEGWVKRGGRVVCETEREVDLGEQVGSLDRIKLKRYGDSLIHVYHREC